MISLEEIVIDSDFAQPFTVQRSTGTFQLGGWVTVSVNVDFYGIITVASDQDLQMLPEGDRIIGAMMFHTQEQIYQTQLEDGYGQSTYGDSSPCNADSGGAGYGVAQQRVSDQIYWRGQLYRVMKVSPWKDFGYWRAIGVRMSGR